MLLTNSRQRLTAEMTGKFSINRAVHLIISDLATQEQVANLLKTIPIAVKSFSSLRSFLAEPLSEVPRCLIVDTTISDTDAVTLIKDMRSHGFSTPIVVIADGERSIVSAVKAIKVGAADFIEKPIIERDFLDRINAILKIDSFR